MNGWLEIYARYHGEDIEANFSIREASLLFLETHDIQDVAEMLTKIPKKKLLCPLLMKLPIFKK